MGGPRKPAEYIEARRLREQDGMPYKRIADRLGISVATAHAWTRDIELTPEQEYRNLHGPRGPANPQVIAARAAAWRRKNRDRRVAYQREGRERAREVDALHVAGCMLFWAEGSKERNSVQLCNSDVNMLRFFRHFVATCFDVNPADFTVRLNVYLGNGMQLIEIERYWLQALDLPRTCLRKPIVNQFPTSSSGKKKNKLPYGVCTLSVYSTRIVQHIYGAIQEYAGFEEPRWLDGPPVKRRRRANHR